MLAALRSTVRAQPWRMIGIAALAGACTGLARSRNPVLRTFADTTLTSLLVAVREAVTAELAHGESVARA